MYVCLQTFEFRVASERMPYSFKTMHAQEIESKLEAKFTRWRDWRLYQQQVRVCVCLCVLRYTSNLLVVCCSH